MAQRAIYGAKDASDIFIPCLIATYVATVTGLLFVSFKQKINLLDRVIITWLGGITAAIVIALVFIKYSERTNRNLFEGVE
jgi:spore maturation protein SpmA